MGSYLSDYYYQITLIRLLLSGIWLKSWSKNSDYYYPGSDWNLDPKIRPVVHEKQLSGSQIRISIRITPNFELGLPMIITSLLTKFHQNATSRFWEILLTDKQTNRHTKVIAISRFSRDNYKDHCGLVFDLTSMQDSTEICHYPEPVREQLRLELNFTFPLEYDTELIVLGNDCLRLQLTSVVLLEKISKMDNVSLQQTIIRIPDSSIVILVHLPLTISQLLTIKLLPL